MKAGETITNLQNGEVLTMLVDAEESNHWTQEYQVVLPPHRVSPPLHYHIAFRETFGVTNGTLEMYLGEERRLVRLSAGDSVIADVGVPHTFANDSLKPCTVVVTTCPAGGVVRAFRLAYGVANEGGAGKDGLPRNPIIRLRFIQISEGFLPRIPLRLQRVLLFLAEQVSKVTGLETIVLKHAPT